MVEWDAMMKVKAIDLRGTGTAGDWRGFILALLLVGAMTAIGAVLVPFVAPANLVMLYLAAVVVVAVYLGRWPSILAAVLSVVVFDFFIVPPRHTMAVADTQYLLTFAGLLVVGLVISSLTSRVREEAEAAERREAQATALYKFSRDLSSAAEGGAILSATIAHIGGVFGGQVAIYLPSMTGRLTLAAASPDFEPNPEDAGAAEWAFEHGSSNNRPRYPAGTTEGHPGRLWCLQLPTPRGTVGVVGVTPERAGTELSDDDRRLLETFAGQAALALERAQLADRAQQAHLLEATEKLHRALLHSISHELRTPLVTITGAFSNLEAAAGRLDEETRASLARAGRQEAERLNHLVGNLLDMARIEAGALRPSAEPADVGEAIGVVLDRLTEQLKDREVRIDIRSDFPPVPMDMPLIVQALVNVVDNAAKYSPEGSPIDIAACQSGQYARIQVADRGIGIPDEDLANVFERFYRVGEKPAFGGTGLGLSISKGIVEAHGGMISASGRQGGGVVIMIDLPLEPRPG